MTNYKLYVLWYAFVLDLYVIGVDGERVHILWCLKYAMTIDLTSYCNLSLCALFLDNSNPVRLVVP